MSETMLILAVYGMEVVEAGGALAANAAAGGSSHAAVLLAREQMQADLPAAAEHLGVATLEFLDLPYGAVEPSQENKRRLVTLLRRIRPTIVITQDPEHIISDLDPDRRPAMTLLLESLALASRDFAADDGLEPLPIPTIYYLTPLHANCVLDVTPHWPAKQAAMDELSSQLAFSATHWEHRLPPEHLEVLVPGYHELPTGEARGRALHRAIDHATHVAAGVGHHGHYAVAERYRREGEFHLPQLLP